MEPIDCMTDRLCDWSQAYKVLSGLNHSSGPRPHTDEDGVGEGVYAHAPADAYSDHDGFKLQLYLDSSLRFGEGGHAHARA